MARITTLLFAAAIACAAGAPAGAHAPGVRRVPVRVPADPEVWRVAVGGDGRSVLYTITAGDDAVMTLRLRDRVTGRDEEIARDVDANVYYTSHSVSGDGRYVVFEGWQRSGQQQPRWTVYLRDRLRRTTAAVGSDARGGGFAAAMFSTGAISRDGSTVTLLGGCIGEGDDHACDLYAYDVRTRRTRVVAHGASDSDYPPTPTGDGRYVAFSSARSLAADDDRPARCNTDVYLADTRNRHVNLVTHAGTIVDSAPAGDGSCPSYSWLHRAVPDDTGRRVLFVAEDYSPGGGVSSDGIWVADRVARTLRRLDEAPLQTVLSNPAGGRTASPGVSMADLSGDGHTAVYWSQYAAGAADANPAGLAPVWRVGLDPFARTRIDPIDAAHPCLAPQCADGGLLGVAALAPGGALAFPYPTVSRDGSVVVWPDPRRLAADDVDNRVDIYAWAR
jgi:hypothetical protein